MEIGIKHVALFTRAWIEIKDRLLYEDIKAVALFTRAWIEIMWNIFKQV